MPYQPVTENLSRQLTSILLLVIRFPVGVIALLAISMEVRGHLALRDHIPAALEPGYFHSGDKGFPSGVVRFSIGRSAAGAIRTEGKAFLDQTAGPGWRPTPLPIEEFRPWEDCGGFWCSRSDVATQATRWVSRPGSFVLLSSETNNETVIVINPAERALIFGYYLD